MEQEWSLDLVYYPDGRAWVMEALGFKAVCSVRDNGLFYVHQTGSDTGHISLESAHREMKNLFLTYAMGKTKSLKAATAAALNS